MTVQFNPITNYYDYVPPGSGGGPVPPVVIPPLLQPYDPAWAYLTGDYVISADTIWEALAPSTGVLPGTNPLVWQQVIPGPALLPPYIPVYDIAYAYDAGRYVMSADKIWLSLGASTGVVPGTNPALWRQVLDTPVIPVWDAAYPYLAGQYVMFADRIYVSLLPTTGVQPDTDPLSWMWVMEKPYLGEWDAAYPYLTDQMVNSAGIIYKALAPSTGVVPVTDPLSWSPLLEDTAHRFLGEWDAAYPYLTNQMVNYQGKVYVCVAPGGDTGTVPGTNWMVWYQRIPGGFINNWDPTFQYINGQSVYLPFFGIYEAIAGSIGLNPNTNPGQWKLLVDTSGVFKEFNFVTSYGVLDYALPDAPTPALVSKMEVTISGGQMHYAAGHFTVAGVTLSFVPATLGFIPQDGMPVRVLYK